MSFVMIDYIFSISFYLIKFARIPYRKKIILDLLLINEWDPDSEKVASDCVRARFVPSYTHKSMDINLIYNK